MAQLMLAEAAQNGALRNSRELAGHVDDCYRLADRCFGFPNDHNWIGDPFLFTHRSKAPSAKVVRVFDCAHSWGFKHDRSCRGVAPTAGAYRQALTEGDCL